MTNEKEEKKTSHQLMTEILTFVKDDEEIPKVVRDMAQYVLDGANPDKDSYDTVFSVLYLCEKMMSVSPTILAEMNRRILLKVILPAMFADDNKDEDNIEIPPDATKH